jgi:hypothetical protein
MFAILVISASAAAPNFGSWAADHTSKLRAWTCTPTRLAYHMCEANTGGANATGTGFAAATPAGKTQINRYNLCSCEATLILKSFEFRGLTVPSCVQPQTGRPPPPWRRRRVANGPWMSTREASRRSYRLLLLGFRASETPPTRLPLLPNANVHRDSGGRWPRERGMATAGVV